MAAMWMICGAGKGGCGVRRRRLWVEVKSTPFGGFIAWCPHCSSQMFPAKIQPPPPAQKDT